MPQSTVALEESRGAFEARLAGSTLREIADDLGLSVEGTRKLLAREAQCQVALLHAKLLEAGAVDLPIPAGDQLEAALRHVHWAVAELAALGVSVRPYVVARGGVMAIGLEEHHASEEEGR
jgi:predicted transcriptional regulator